MIRSYAARFVVLAVTIGAPPVLAQTAEAPEGPALQRIITTELPADTQELAMQLVRLSGTSRMYDEVLPMVADQAKNLFIRANPQMQLGIIDMVDRVALSLVGRRGELDQYLARVWASAFTNEEMQDLIDFYSSETGKKFAETLPELLAVQTAAAQEWGKSVNADLSQRVANELRAVLAAEQEALQSDIAGPAQETAPQQ